MRFLVLNKNAFKLAHSFFTKRETIVTLAGSLVGANGVEPLTFAL